VLTVTIVGLGPWGLSLLERLVTTLRAESRPEVRIHVVEPGAPGVGVYDTAQPDWLILNTPCGQHSMYPLPAPGPQPRYAVDFHTWVGAQGYRWVDERCERTSAGRPVSPHDFLPRRLMGEYLAWFYRTLVAEAPAGVQVVHHPYSAQDVTASASGETVWLSDGTRIPSDHVVLATGHTPTLSGHRSLGELLPPYPVERYHRKVSAGDAVGVAGMGLVALDVVTALTVGRGGRYRADGGSRLRYQASGEEPTVSLFSPSGEAYCAKAVALADPTGDYQPVICTPQAVTALQTTGEPLGQRRQIDARRELMPLVFAEMSVRYHQQAATLRDGPDAGAGVPAVLGRAWRDGSFDAEVARLARLNGEFDPAAHFFSATGRDFATAKDYEEHTYAAIAGDLDAALVEGGASPVKAAYEVLRVLRDTMRQAIEFSGLTLASYRDFQANIRGRVNRLVAGPPALRSQQLLALLDAGVVRLPAGPAPMLEVDPEGHPTLRSTRLVRPHSERLDLLVQGHLDDPALVASGSRLLTNLHTAGRLTEMHYGEEPVGSIALDDALHPLDTAGSVQRRLWVFGAVSEGARYFTHYIPSPRSRVRAFLDAQRCVDALLA
jgi:hypothetical protein